MKIPPNTTEIHKHKETPAARLLINGDAPEMTTLRKIV
jgi:hypothetical protein